MTDFIIHFLISNLFISGIIGLLMAVKHLFRNSLSGPDAVSSVVFAARTSGRSFHTAAFSQILSDILPACILSKFLRVIYRECSKRTNDCRSDRKYGLAE